MVFFLGVLAIFLRRRFENVTLRLLRRLTAYRDKDGKETSAIHHNEGQVEAVEGVEGVAVRSYQPGQQAEYCEIWA